MSEPQIPVTSINIAYQGQHVDMKDFPEKAMPKAVDLMARYKINPESIDFVPGQLDWSELEELNQHINDLRIRMHLLRIEHNKARRVTVKLKRDYASKKNRTLALLSGGTEKGREAIAEIMCQDLYSEWLVADAVAQEIKDAMFSSKMELSMLQELGSNQRQQMKIQ